MTTSELPGNESLDFPQLGRILPVYLGEGVPVQMGNVRSANFTDIELGINSFPEAAIDSQVMTSVAAQPVTNEGKFNPVNQLLIDNPVTLNGNVFLEPREFGVYDEGAYMKKLSRACAELADSGVPQDVLDQSMAFMERAFGIYNGRIKLANPGSHVFIIPTFLSSWQNGEYNSEVKSSLPLADYVDSATLVNIVAGVPPCIIESYPPDTNGNQAHVVFAPVMPDIFADLGFGGGMRMSQKVIEDTVRFAHDRVGASVAGLGAMLPAAVGLGEKIDVKGIVTTTGHGGTVNLLSKTVHRVIEERGVPNNTIGVVGAIGSIGRASLSTLLQNYPGVEFVVTDPKLVEGGAVSPQSVERFLSLFNTSDSTRITVAATLEEVFKKAKINVSAISGTIDVASEVKSNLKDVVIVDDSQPGAFSRKAVEDKGGKVVWVVGQDYTENGGLTRMGDFRYGDVGLLRNKDVFGCEAEAFAVYQSGEHDNAIKGRVTPQLQEKIGRLFSDHGIDVTDTLQSEGKPVSL